MVTEWFVSYQVPQVSAGKVHIIGPYKSVSDAERDLRDISSYAGITNLLIYKENVDDLVDAKMAVD